MRDIKQSSRWTGAVALLAVPLLAAGLPAAASEIGMFANSPSRNMVSDATGLPSSWDPESGENVKWKQQLGSQSYGGAVRPRSRCRRILGRSSTSDDPASPATSTSCKGTVNWKVEPQSTTLDTSSRPPMSSTRRLLIVNPSPVPP